MFEKAPSSKPDELKLDLFEIKSKFYYMLGFIVHSNPSIPNYRDKAEKHYKKAIELYWFNYSAHFGLGQIFTLNYKIQRYGKYLEWASRHFEVIVKYKSEVECCDCYKIMAYIFTHMGNKMKAIEYFEKGIKYHPFDIEF